MTDQYRIERLGTAIAEEQDALLIPMSLDSLAVAPRPQTSPRRRWPVLVGLAAIAAAGLVYIAIARTAGPTPPAFELGRAPAKQVSHPDRLAIHKLDKAGLLRPVPIGEDGDTWFSSSGDPLTIGLSDGSQLTLRPATAMRVRRADAKRVEIEHALGSVNYQVGHAITGRVFTVWAGPYAVQALGTRFDVDWSPAIAHLRVEVSEGRVAIRGPGGTHELVQGDVFENGQPNRDARTGIDEVAPAVVTTKAAGRPTKSTRQPVPPSQWQQLAHQGAFHAAYPRLRPVLGATSRDGDASTLVLAAKVCQLSGHSDEARELFLTIRQRFAGTAQATRAAFELGRIASASVPERANDWFARYLREDPKGVLSQAAWGRRLELSQRLSGHLPEVIAADYLQRFPRGPHRELARRVVGQTTANTKEHPAE